MRRERGERSRKGSEAERVRQLVDGARSVAQEGTRRMRMAEMTRLCLASDSTHQPERKSGACALNTPPRASPRTPTPNDSDYARAFSGERWEPEPFINHVSQAL